MPIRDLAIALPLIGAALMALAGWQCVLSWDRPAATLDASGLEIQGIQPGAPATASVVIRNDSRHTVRVVGLGTC